ncbi:MAG: hypothetical protein RRB13_02860 [bacterium]|nr:hypothetical protein [bacterium]
MTSFKSTAFSLLLAGFLVFAWSSKGSAIPVVKLQVTDLERAREMAQQLESLGNQVKLNDPDADKNLLPTLEVKFNGPVPIIEFAKAAPTRYLLRIHQAPAQFPLIFREGYHYNWKLFAFAPTWAPVPSERLQEYQILTGNERDQADLETLKEFVAKGWVTDLGDGSQKERKLYQLEGLEAKEEWESYQVDFVARRYANGIQNDNLPIPAWYESFTKNFWFAQNHYKIEPYGNFWWIDTKELLEEGLARRNADGTLELQLLVQFSPQRVYNLWLILSLLTVGVTLAYFGWARWGAKKSSS